MRRLIAPAVLVCALVPALASAKPLVSLTLTGTTLNRAADGHQVRTPVEKTSLKPGDIVEYDVAAKNGGDSPAIALVPMGRIPAGTAFVEGSAHAAGARIEYSLDGKTFAIAPTVAVKTAAGIVIKKADPSTYTAVRFVSTGALAPKTVAHYTYEVRVK